MNPQAKAVVYETPFKLIVTFKNNEIKAFDLQPYLHYPVYQHLQDEALCSQVSVINGIVVWDEETDLDPDRLYLESKTLSMVS